ncbi:MAG: cytidine deaminase [wastewater metagenome]|nr:cytidine deaminase [Candidatus Loosdrechtia aerotolerans]
MHERELMKIALEARKNAYAPYSGFKVGAALLARNGKIYTGCNAEISTYSNTICAERSAVFKAVSEGERTFEAIAITAGTDDYIYPCGICRQVFAEFCDNDFKIICTNAQHKYEVYTLGELLPKAFKLKNYNDLL